MAQDVRPYKSKEQDGHGNEIILRDQQLVEQGNATTMPSGACFETLDVDNRPVKIPRDNMMNIVLECIGIILNDSSKNLGTNVQKALGLQGNTIGHSTVADFASVLGGVSSILLKGNSESTVSTTTALGGDRRMTGNLSFFNSKTGIVIMIVDEETSVYSFTSISNKKIAKRLSDPADENVTASLVYYSGGWKMYIYGSTDKSITYKALYYNG